MHCEPLDVMRRLMNLRQPQILETVYSAICVIAICCTLLALSSIPGALAANTTTTPADVVHVRMIRTKDCEPCDRAYVFLQKVAAKDEWIRIQALDVSTSNTAREIYEQLLELFDVTRLDLPVTIVGTHAVTGYMDDETTGMEILGTAQYCRWFGCQDILDALGQNSETVVDVKSLNPAGTHPRLKMTMKDREHCALNTD